jgi:hypothetical protein
MTTKEQEKKHVRFATTNSNNNCDFFDLTSLWPTVRQRNFIYTAADTKIDFLLYLHILRKYMIELYQTTQERIMKICLILQRIMMNGPKQQQN